MNTVTAWHLPLDDVDQVRSLHRMLMECKFDEVPADQFLGSPHIAAIQHRLADILTDAEPTEGWQRWRQADQHPHRIEKIRRYLQKSTTWPTMPTDSRRQFVQDLLAPLTPSPELLDELTNV